MNQTIKEIIYQGLLGAIYFCLTMITYPISFLGIQFRIAEMLIIACFFNKKNVIGVTIGCVLANLVSGIGPIDALFGGLATFISAIVVAFSPLLFASLLFTILTNSFVVGAELYFVLKEPFLVSVGLVAIGESVVLVVGYILIQIFKHNKTLLKLVNANQHIEFKM